MFHVNLANNGVVFFWGKALFFQDTVVLLLCQCRCLKYFVPLLSFLGNDFAAPFYFHWFCLLLTHCLGLNWHYYCFILLENGVLWNRKLVWNGRNSYKRDQLHPGCAGLGRLICVFNSVSVGHFLTTKSSFNLKLKLPEIFIPLSAKYG